MTGARLRRSVPALTRGALVLIGLSPFIPRLVRGVPLLSAFGDGLEAWFAFQCNRDPARSFQLLGELLPVCVRCLGIYLGLGLGALIERPRLGVWPLRIWVGVAAIAMLLDVATEALAMRPPWWPLRLATGLALAYPVGAALVAAARDFAAGPDAPAQSPNT